MFNRIASFSPVLVAAVHKGAAPVLVADAIATAAEKFASNAGARNLLQTIETACTTTEKGATRTPAAATAAGLILASMRAIMTRAEGVKARPNDGTPEERTERAGTFAETIRAEYVASVQAASDARKAARAAAAPAAAPAAASSEGSGVTVTPAAASVGPVAAEIPASIALSAVASLETREFCAAASAAPLQMSALRALLAAFDAAASGVTASLQGAAETAVQDSADSAAPAVAAVVTKVRKGRRAASELLAA